MLGRHSKVVDVSEVLLKESSVATRDDVDNVLRVGGENGESLEKALGGDGGAGILYDGSEGAVCEREDDQLQALSAEWAKRTVVEEQETLASVLVASNELLLLEGRGVLRGLLALK